MVLGKGPEPNSRWQWTQRIWYLEGLPTQSSSKIRSGDHIVYPLMVVVTADGDDDDDLRHGERNLYNNDDAGSMLILFLTSFSL